MSVRIGAKTAAPVRGTEIAKAQVATTSKPKASEHTHAPGAKRFVDAYKNAESAQSQMAMVAGSVDINKAADQLLKTTTDELAYQLTARGKGKAASAATAELEKFSKTVGQPRGYYVDPDRGSMAALEDNDDRLTKVMAQLAKVTAQLEKANAEPAADNQQAFNRQAFGDRVAQEARFALAFNQAYASADDPQSVITQSEKFLSRLPARVESQIECRGGTMEPLERYGLTADALKAMAAQLGK